MGAGLFLVVTSFFYGFLLFGLISGVRIRLVVGIELIGVVIQIGFGGGGFVFVFHFVVISEAKFWGILLLVTIGAWV